MNVRALRRPRPEHSILNFVGVADLVTVLGLLMGVASIFASLTDHFISAALLIAGSVACDFFDGKLARKLGTEGDFGISLDGFNDFLTYLVAVAVFGYAAGLTSPLALACLLAFVTLGTLRLARFSVIGVVNGYYEGLPASFSLLVIPACLMIRAAGGPIELLLPLYILIGLLMVTTIRVKKPGK